MNPRGFSHCRDTRVPDIALLAPVRTRELPHGRSEPVTPVGVEMPFFVFQTRARAEASNCGSGHSYVARWKHSLGAEPSPRRGASPGEEGQKDRWGVAGDDGGRSRSCFCFLVAGHVCVGCGWNSHVLVLSCCFTRHSLVAPGSSLSPAGQASRHSPRGSLLGCGLIPGLGWGRVCFFVGRRVRPLLSLGCPATWVSPAGVLQYPVYTLRS